jgi:hypothetical protein
LGFFIVYGEYLALKINYESFDLENFIGNHEARRWMGGDLENSLHSLIVKMIVKWGSRLSKEEINQLGYSVLVIPPKATSDIDFRDKLKIAIIKELNDLSLNRMLRSLIEDEGDDKSGKNIQYFEEVAKEIKRREETNGQDSVMLKEIIEMVGDCNKMWGDILSKRLEGLTFSEIVPFINDKYKNKYNTGNIQKNYEKAINYISQSLS